MISVIIPSYGRAHRARAVYNNLVENSSTGLIDINFVVEEEQAQDYWDAAPSGTYAARYW
jgi:hypothetical protein